MGVPWKNDLQLSVPPKWERLGIPILDENKFNMETSNSVNIPWLLHSILHSPWCILYMNVVTTKQSGRDGETAEMRSFPWKQT
jgi:hypothetical protein